VKGVVVITGESGTIPGEFFEPSACFIRVDGSSPVTERSGSTIAKTTIGSSEKSITKKRKVQQGQACMTRARGV